MLFELIILVFLLFVLTITLKDKKITPIKAIEKNISQRKFSKKIKKINSRYDKILKNIDSYDGTDRLQKSIEKGLI